MDTFDVVARRFFLKLLGGAAVAAAAPACSSEASDSAASAVSEESKAYDYIVVGSGAGGGPLAANLARQGFEVLLLEAGEDHGDSPVYQVPAFNAASAEDPDMRWDYFVQHYDDPKQQAKDSKADPRGVYYPRAGTLGGCTAHNALITVYPHESDWEYIAGLTDDDSWLPWNMRRYYEVLENCEYLQPGQSTDGHGKDGWLTVSKPDPSTIPPDPSVLAILNAAAIAFLAGDPMMSNVYAEFIGDAQKLLTAINSDLNSADPMRDTTEGLFSVPLAMKAGARNGPREYVKRVEAKYKLKIQTRALVTNVVFEPRKDASEPLRAIGVNYIDGTGMDPVEWKNTGKYRADRDAPANPQPMPATKTARIKPTGEVILAAGAFNTPQLLKLSGIGPRDELKTVGIDTLVDLPGVGTNLQDRYEVTVVTEWDAEFNVLSGCTFGQGNDPCFATWAQGHANGKAAGVYSSGPVVGIVKRSRPELEDPDLFVFGFPGAFKGYELGFSREIEVDRKHFTWGVLKAHTNNATGTVTLKSKDPRETPDIRFRYFQDGAEDMDAVVQGVQLARGISSALPPVLAQMKDGATFKEVVPGPSVQTDDQLKEFVKNEAWGHHASCTCPIGPQDSGGVLDSRFRVYGTQGLRVVDASVFPKIPGFFIVVPIYMVSEKAFDVLLEDASPSQKRNLGAL